ncbi:MAG TPA: hypothetical protein VKX17_23365 [Planctomycetota bacterium]|nr:hypothetical protein [Planctomycetota bacterium]
MSEDEVLHVLNVHGVDYMLAVETQHFKSPGVSLLVMNIFVDDSVANLTDLNFALTELCGKREADDFSLHEIPNDAKWLSDAPAHIIRCPELTLNVALRFPGIKDSYQTVKKRAELVIRPGGEMLYTMGMNDKLAFVQAFVKQHEGN